MDKFCIHFLLITCLCMGILHAAVEDNAANSDQGGIETVLIELEKIRKNNNQKFSDQLTALQVQVPIMTADEQCLYQYLVIYRESYKGDYAESINGLQQAEQLCESPEYKARVVQFIANLQVITGDFESALKNLNTAIQITESTKDSYLRSLTNNVAAISYRLMNQDEIALKYSELLLDDNHTEEDRCMGAFNKYRILMRQGKGADYDSEIMTAIERCERIDNKIAALFLQFDQIRYQFPNKESSDSFAALTAVETLESLAEAVNHTQFKNIRVYYHALLAHMYWIANMNNQAKSFGQMAVDENDSIGESEQLLLALNVLVRLNFEAENLQAAYMFLIKKNQTEKAIYERKLASQVAYYRVKHANLAQELQIKQLSQNNQLLSLENKLAAETSKKQQLMMLLTISILVLLALWTYRIRKKRDYFKQVAEIDHLTQVFTRKAFEEKVNVMLDACAAKNIPLYLAIMDLDHFKTVNDQYGHLVGDWVLKQVILTCKGVAEQDILMARLGGEEFCLVSTQVTQPEMIELMQRMRLAIEQMDCSGSGSVFNITASFGISRASRSGYRISTLLTHADVALFEAKNLGRNRVIVFDKANQQSPTA